MTVNKSDSRVIISIIFFTIILNNLLPLISSLSVSVRSEIEGDGFHRTLKYYVDTGSFKNKSCHLAVVVQLPAALYVNIDELADLRRLQMSSSCSDGEIDVELFTEKANSQNATICSRLTNTKTTLTIPIHQRYQFATINGVSVNISIGQPKLLIGCKDRLKEHRVSKIKVCWPCVEYSKKWRDVPYRWEGDADFVWQIPVGNISLRFEVTCITLLITLTGAAYVLWTVHNSYKIPKDKKLNE